MRLLPYQRISIRTQVPAEVVLQRLAAEVEPVRWMRFPFPPVHRRFEGGVTAHEFKLVRIVRGRDSFRPVVVGRIRSTATATVLEATLRLHYVVAVGMALSLGAFGVFGLGDEMRQLALVPAAMIFAFSCLLMQFTFLSEAGHVTQFLEEITKGP